MSLKKILLLTWMLVIISCLYPHGKVQTNHDGGDGQSQQSKRDNPLKIDSFFGILLRILKCNYWLILTIFRCCYLMFHHLPDPQQFHLRMVQVLPSQCCSFGHFLMMNIHNNLIQLNIKTFALDILQDVPPRMELVKKKYMI